jgi:dTDP-4-dehydrorhamnose 3,5-epimerase
MAMIGTRDPQSVAAGGRRSAPPRIKDVEVLDLGNVMTRSGWMLEVFRADWPASPIAVQQVNWVELAPGAVTDWHCHSQQTDRLIGVGGNIKLALWDGRDESPTKGSTDVFRIGAMRPLMIVVPPGIWHGLRNESGAPAGYINLTDRLYDYEKPDNWRLTPGAAEIAGVL